MAKGQFPKVKGSICNVPVEANVCEVLPRGINRNNIVFVQLKRKMSHAHHVYSEAVRPDFLISILNYLKENNELYSDIKISPEEIVNIITSNS